MQNIYVSIHNMETSTIEVCSHENGPASHFWMNVGHLTLFFPSLDAMTQFGLDIVTKSEAEVARLEAEKSPQLSYSGNPVLPRE